MTQRLPLAGVRVHLAGAVPDQCTDAQREDIESFVRTLAAEVLRDGGTLIHGSHPSF
jgi:uncharacterized protein